MKVTFRPLPMWTDRETTVRPPAPFFSSWTDTMQLLDKEIDTLCNGNKYDTDVILQVAAPESAMRVDGGIRADAKVSHPGVIVSFTGPKGPMRFATDHFEASSKMIKGQWVRTPAWQNNVRAIALALQDLRRIARYGINQGDEQYRGFTAIGDGTPMVAGPMSVETAAMFLVDFATPNVSRSDTIERLIADEEYRTRAYRSAARQLHPDRGGDTAQFQRLQEAKAVLDG